MLINICSLLSMKLQLILNEFLSVESLGESATVVRKHDTNATTDVFKKVPLDCEEGINMHAVKIVTKFKLDDSVEKE